MPSVSRTYRLLSQPGNHEPLRTRRFTKEKRRDFVYLRALGGYFFHHLLIHHAPAFPEPDAACSLNFPPSAAALSSPSISAHRRTYAIPFPYRVTTTSVPF